MLGTVASKRCKTNDYAHTKTGNCAIFDGTPTGLIFTDKDSLYSMDGETFDAEIREAVYKKGKDRVTPLMYGIVAMSVSGGDLRTSQEGFGPETPNGLNALREDYTIDSGGFCLYKQLSKLNGRQMRVFKIDASGNIFGTAIIKDGEEKFRGYSATIGVSRRISTGEQTGAILLSILYRTNFQNEDINTHSVEFSGGDIEGLEGIKLKKTAAGKAKVITSCESEDITELLGADLAEPDLYVSKTGTKPTAVIYASGELTFTPAAAYRIVDAAALQAANINGYEGENEYVDIA
jgi:hypothetical protein